MLRRTPMPARWTPLRRMSAKRAAVLTAPGKPAVTAPRPRDTGPSKATVALVVVRDAGRCGWCGSDITGLRGWDWSVSHRRPRRAGGDPRPDTNSTANLLLVHGHALSLCHHQIEQRRVEAARRGHILTASAVPSQVAVDHAAHGGWVLLDDEGGYRAVAA